MAKPVGAPFLPSLLVTTSLIAVGVACFAPVPAQAQSAQVAFDLPAQPLSRSLVQLSGLTGLQLFFDAGLVRSKNAQAVKGSLSGEQALARLLAGSGLNYRITGNTVTITGSASPAGANSNVAGADGAVVLDTITISGGGGLGSHDLTYESAGSVNYISSREIEQRRGTSAGDFIAGNPGVMNGENRNSGALDVNIRGMQGQGRVPVIIDGASQESTVYRGYNGAASRSYVDPDLIGEVLIEKGANNEAMGATGGAVRMSTIGVKDIVLPGKSWGVRVKGGFNTNSSSIPALGTAGGVNGAAIYSPGSLPSNFGAEGGMDRPGIFAPTGGNGSIAYGWTSDAADLVAAYVRRRNGNYHAGSKGDGGHPVFTTRSNGQIMVTRGGLTSYRAGEEVLNTSYDTASYLLKGTLRLENGHSLELGYSRYESEYGDIMPSQIWSAAPYQGYLNDIALDTYTARYGWNPDDNDLINLKADLFLTDNANRVRSSLRTLTTPFPQYYYTDDRRYGANLSNTSSFETRFGELDVKFGANYVRETTGLPKEYREDQSFLGYYPFLPRSGWREEVSGLAALTWKPVEKLTLDTSLRYSHFQTFDEHLGRQIVDASTTPPTYLLLQGTPTSRSGDGWSPNVSAKYEIIDGLSVYGKYAEATRMPSIFEALQGFSVGSTYSFDLAPEQSRNLEAGINFNHEGLIAADDRLRVHLAYFDNHVDNYITRVDTKVERSPGNYSYVPATVNLDYARLRGIELELAYENGPFTGSLAWNHYTSTMFCAVADSMNPRKSTCGAGGIDSSYSLQHVPPKDTVTLSLGYRLFDEKLTIGGRMTHVGKRAVDGVGDGTDLSSVTSTVRPGMWKPYTIFDFNARYEIDEASQIDFAIDNVTDRYYLDGLSASLVPAPGRTIRMNFTRKF